MRRKSPRTGSRRPRTRTSPRTRSLSSPRSRRRRCRAAAPFLRTRARRVCVCVLSVDRRVTPPLYVLLAGYPAVPPSSHSTDTDTVLLLIDLHDRAVRIS
ncbi:hypothetical protein C8J57DRAFT_1515220 [Mycena rebaudengoi]|nr:hypothetical protein C8J57DRAFT_1515220 [Mycena rebaudengoi]